MRLPSLVLVSALLSTTGCRPARDASERPTPLLEVASGDERFGRVRPLLEDLGQQRYPKVRIKGAGASPHDADVTVDLPATRRANGLDVLVIVRVHERATDVGKIAATTDAELVAAAFEHTRGKRAVALVRAEDRTLMRDVVRVIRAMEAGGFRPVILATIPADADATPAGWNGKSEDCVFPEATSIGEAALVDVEDDGHGRPATVRIVAASSPVNAYAAAVCASRQHIEADANTFPSTGSLRFRILNHTPLLMVPRDP